MNNIFDGDKTDIINILPGYIDNTNFKYLKLDNKYICNITICDYPKKIQFLQLIEALPKSIEYDISFYIQKQDSYNILRQLTKYISSSKAEIKTINKNQLDYDLINKVSNDAQELRRQIQINNEEIFYINIYLTLYNVNKEQLLIDVKKIQSKLYSNQFISNITNFRHLDSYILTLPLINFQNKLIKNTYRNIITSSLNNIFPFYTRNVFDKNGIIFGYTAKENKLYNIDIFSNEYTNSNMCILGSSGSGKSFFTKILIIRHFFNNKYQYIFDPEGEYIQISEKLNMEYIIFNNKNINKYINILDINEFEVVLYGKNVIENKIQEIKEFLLEIIGVNNEKEIIELENAIRLAYKKYDINDLESLYMDEFENKIYISKVLRSKILFPTLKDVLEKIENKELNKKVKTKIINKYTCLTNNTNMDIMSKLVVFDLSNIDSKDSVIFSKYFLNIIKNILTAEKVKIESKKNTIIYIDEIWKLINSKEESLISENIFSLFKTIRKLNAGIISITQDISDFFSFQDGIYGKSILNNCAFKIFFKIEYSDTEILNNLSEFNDKIIKNISILNKGQAMIIFKGNISIINIKISNYEKKIMEE